MTREEEIKLRESIEKKEKALDGMSLGEVLFVVIIAGLFCIAMLKG